jgi:hypothetical protein
MCLRNRLVFWFLSRSQVQALTKSQGSGKEELEQDCESPLGVSARDLWFHGGNLASQLEHLRRGMVLNMEARRFESKRLLQTHGSGEAPTYKKGIYAMGLESAKNEYRTNTNISPMIFRYRVLGNMLQWRKLAHSLVNVRLTCRKWQEMLHPSMLRLAASGIMKM